MHIILETLTAIGLIFYYIIEAWVRFLIPARFISKDVKGHSVLITGAG